MFLTLEGLIVGAAVLVAVLVVAAVLSVVRSGKQDRPAGSQRVGLRRRSSTLVRIP